MNCIKILFVDLNKIDLGKIWKGAWNFSFFSTSWELYFSAWILGVVGNAYFWRGYMTTPKMLPYAVWNVICKLWKKKKDAGRRKINNTGGWYCWCRSRRRWLCAAICVVGVHIDFVKNMLSFDLHLTSCWICPVCSYKRNAAQFAITANIQG